MKVKKILVLSLDEARTWIAKVQARDLAERPEHLVNELLNDGLPEVPRALDLITQRFVDGDLGAELAAGFQADTVAIEFGNPVKVEMENDKLTVVWEDKECSCPGPLHQPRECPSCQGSSTGVTDGCPECGGRGHLPGCSDKNDETIPSTGCWLDTAREKIHK